MDVSCRISKWMMIILNIRIAQHESDSTSSENLGAKNHALTFLFLVFGALGFSFARVFSLNRFRLQRCVRATQKFLMMDFSSLRTRESSSLSAILQTDWSTGGVYSLI